MPENGFLLKQDYEAIGKVEIARGTIPVEL
jgi:hypothetical protein